jgi:hypothetical protein
MAFSYAYWDKLSAAGNESVPTLWGYSDTATTRSAMTADGFFNDVASLLDVGDLLYLKGSDGSMTVQVAATSPNVTVTDNPGIAAGSIVNADISSSAAIDYSKIAANNILLTASTSVTAAQFKAAFTTPVQLVAAAGAGIAYFLESVVINMEYAAPAYADGGNVLVQYGAAAAGTAASEVMTAANFFATADTTFSAKAADLNVATATIANAGLYLSNLTGAFTAGNSAMTVTVWYRQLLVA